MTATLVAAAVLLALLLAGCSDDGGGDEDRRQAQQELSLAAEAIDDGRLAAARRHIARARAHDESAPRLTRVEDALAAAVRRARAERQRAEARRRAREERRRQAAERRRQKRQERERAETPPSPPADSGGDCDPNYGGCVPQASDVDCAGGSGDGPEYVSGPIPVTGTDVYGLDSDGDGVACE